jgi:hypothetical protein
VAWWWYDPLGSGGDGAPNRNRNAATRPARPAR